MWDVVIELIADWLIYSGISDNVVESFADFLSRYVSFTAIMVVTGAIVGGVTGKIILTFGTSPMSSAWMFLVVAVAVGMASGALISGLLHLIFAPAMK